VSECAQRRDSQRQIVISLATPTYVARLLCATQMAQTGPAQTMTRVCRGFDALLDKQADLAAH
jgi:hypothetical protein